MVDDRFRQRERDLARVAAADLAGKIERHQRDMVAVDVEPDRKGAVGIDDDPHRGLTTLALQAARRFDEAEIDQSLCDVHDRRRREAGHPREVAARRLFGQADRLEHDPLIIVARALEVGARQAERQPRVARLWAARGRLAAVATRKVETHCRTVLQAGSNARRPPPNRFML